ncbi:MAG: MFS transporter [Alphaproteobacteria bacterium]|nr:MFS transporter [Alphaproteobacteria bacterium]
MMMPTLPSPQSTYFSIPRQIWGIGWGVFFINTSSVMVRAIAAVYLKALGVEIGWIGLLEGFIEGLSFVIKTFAGVISDYLRRRKAFVTIGYILIALSNPIIALWATFGGVFVYRVIARIGNGIQATPRDALVADIAPAKSRGACYGLRVGLGIAGSFAGAFIAWHFMHRTSNNYQQLFWLATVPAIVAVLIVLIFVKEPKKNLHPKDHQTRHPIHWADLPRLGRQFWTLMGVVAIFMIAQVGEPFMVLHAHLNFGLLEADAPIIFLLFNATHSASSLPVGMLSDRMSRYHLLALGFLVLIASDLILATATNLTSVFIGIAIWGFQMGIHQSMFLALIADNSPDDLRGTALSVYYLICGASLFLANTCGGIVAQVFGSSSTYLFSFVVAAIALFFLVFIMPKKRDKSNKPIA